MMGGAGNDTIDGGAGNDTVSYASATGSVTVNLSSNSSSGSAGNDMLYNIENITGSAYNDKLTGDNSNNVIIGGDGNDTLDGGAGNDTASYINATASVTVSLATLLTQDTGGAGFDTLTNIENLTGSGFNDTLTGNNNSNNYISGGDGADTLNVTLGNDTLDGGTGIDTVSFISITNSVTVALNIDTSQFFTGGYIKFLNIENLNGTIYNDRLTGSSGDNIILGGAGNDTINGFWGDDTIDGGSGNDSLDGSDDNDTVSYASSTGAVTVSLDNDQPQNTGSAGTDTLSNFENLTGSGSNDSLTGSSQDNVITGGAGNDTIIGGAGNDTLIGGTGNDNIDGGQGNDTVIWRIGDGNDTVSLGIGSNTLDLEGWAGGSVTSGAISGAWGVALAGTKATFTNSGGGSVTVTDWSVGTNSVICILPGTRITTPDGHRPIETLTPGDIVTTPDGPRPVRWVGRSRYSMVFLRGKPMCLPVRIHAGALGQGLPARDLWVSPWHALLIGQTLVRAFDLINGQNVTQDYQGQIASFYNVELDSPDIIFAEGTPVETYANHNNRAMFHNLDEYLALYGSHEPSWMRADGTGIRRHPLLDENAAELAPIRQAVLARATNKAA
jgi:Ca2+-binding RTX toxin-like protein